MSALGLAYGEPAPHLSSVVFRAQSLVRGPVTLWHPPGRHRPLSSGWVTCFSSTVMSQALEDQRSPAHPGAMPDPRSLQSLTTGSPPQDSCPLPPSPASGHPLRPWYLGHPAWQTPPPALQDRPLPSGLRPPWACPAVTVPSLGVQPLVEHNLSSPERATMQTPKKGLMTPSCRPAPLGPRLDRWGGPLGSRPRARGFT